MRLNMKHILRYLFLPLLTVVLIFIATCLISFSSVPSLPEGFGWDKLVHFCMFFGLSAVSLIDYYRLCRGTPPFGRWVFWGFIIPVVYGGAIELIQKYFVPTRGAEWGDWLADILGSLVATVVIIIFLRKRRYTEKNISL